MLYPPSQVVKRCVARALLCLFLFCPVRAAPQNSGLQWLHAQGMEIANEQGRTVCLRGINVGGLFHISFWMMAFDMSGRSKDLPQIVDERSLWQVFRKRFGDSGLHELQELWRSVWFNDADLENIARSGMNVIRLPFFYRLLQSDKEPDKLDPAGLKMLDHILDICAQNRIYVILDLQGAPGGQSEQADTSQKGQNQLFYQEHWREQTIKLWRALARHYAGRPEIAGYDILNEPYGAADRTALVAFYNRLYGAIRELDQRHIIIFEEKECYLLPAPRQMHWSNVCFSRHIYPNFMQKTVPFVVNRVLPIYKGEQQRLQVPLFIGEFNIGKEQPYELKKISMLWDAFNEYQWSWTVWGYKQIEPDGGTKTLWGLYSNQDVWDCPRPYTDSLAVLKRKFRKYDSGNLVCRPGYFDALSQAVRK